LAPQDARPVDGDVAASCGDVARVAGSVLDATAFAIVRRMLPTMSVRRNRLRRSSAAREARRFAARTAAVEWEHGSPASADPPPVGYVRLAVGDGSSGVFTAALGLRDGGRLNPVDAAELAALLGWFDRELKPHAPAERRAVFWFRADAVEHVRRIWGVVRFLQRHGQVVRMWTTRRPGRIVFRDDHQVAAVPHRAGRPQAKQLPAANG
jgi:hypothetical protein